MQERKCHLTASTREKTSGAYLVTILSYIHLLLQRKKNARLMCQYQRVWDVYIYL